jgi:hypothetical protein
MSWVDPATFAGENYWTLNETDGTLYPTNTTVDLLVGGTSTASAKFLVEATTGQTFINADSLTTGFGLNVTSASNNLTTGGLAHLSWNPSSPTTATGDLFVIDVNGNATVNGDLFSIKSDGTTLFRVSQTGIESAVPHSFTAAGDVTMAYDLLFSNQSASYIKSNAPLYIQVGESFESNDLTLQTYNSGDIVINNLTNGMIATFQGATGNVGIGTDDPKAKLHVSGGYGSNALAILNQTNSGNVISASSSGTTVMNLTNTGNMELRSSVTNADRLTIAPFNAGSNSFTGTLTSTDLTADRTWTLPDNGGTLALTTDIPAAPTTYWSLTNEQLHAKNALWHDVLVGGTSTASATIALQAETGNILADGAISAATSVTANDLKLRDTNQSNLLTVLWNEDDTADRTLSLLLAGGNRSLTLNEDFTIGDGFAGTLTYSASGKTLTITESSTIDQNLAIAASPTFAGATLGNITVGVADDNTITTSTGILALDSAGGLILAKDNFQAEGAATISGTLAVGTIDEQVTDPDYVLTYNSGTGILEYLDTSGWDKDSSDDLTAADLLWTLTDEQIHPKNALWNDLLIGGTSTASASIALQADTGAITASGNITSGGAVTGDSVYVRDTNQSHALNIRWNEDDTANRILNLLVSGADRSLTLGADVAISQPLTVNGNFGTTITSEGQANTITFNEAFTIGDGFGGTLTYSASGKTLTIAESSTIDQNLATTASPSFANLALTNQGELRLMETTGNGSFYTGFKAPANLDANYVYTLPSSFPGTSGYILTSGDNGVMSWIDPGTLPSSNYWTLNSTDGTLYPNNSTLDLLIGGTSTAAASIALQADTAYYRYFLKPGDQ